MSYASHDQPSLTPYAGVDLFGDDGRPSMQTAWQATNKTSDNPFAIPYDGNGPSNDDFMKMLLFLSGTQDGAVEPAELNSSGSSFNTVALPALPSTPVQNQVLEELFSTPSDLNPSPPDEETKHALHPAEIPAFDPFNFDLFPPFPATELAPAPMSARPLVRRRSRAASIVQVADRHARWTGLAPTLHRESSFGRAQEVQPLAANLKRKRSICDVSVRRIAAPACRQAPYGMPMRIPTVATSANVRAMASARVAGPIYQPAARPPAVARLAASTTTPLRSSLPAVRPTATPVLPTIQNPCTSTPSSSRHPPAATPDALDALDGGPHLPNSLVSTLFTSTSAQRVSCGLGCGALIETTRSALRDHAEAHGRRPARQEDGVHCGWHDCPQIVQWSGFARHLASHVGTMGGRCGLCAGSIGRADMAGRHIRACWGRMDREERVKRLEALRLRGGIKEGDVRATKRARVR